MFKRPTIPLIIVFVIGVAAFAQEYVAHPWAGQFRKEMTDWFRIVGGFAMVLGAYSLLHMHSTRIKRRVAGWGYSGFVFLGFAVMVALGMWNNGYGPLKDAGAGQKTWFDWGYTYVQAPCQATIFSILAFFMASAAFRTFRARNVGATLLLVSALIVMIGRVPLSEALGQWLFGRPQMFADAAGAIMMYPNVAAQRGIILGISLGLISQSVRVIFGIERSYLGGQGK